MAVRTVVVGAEVEIAVGTVVEVAEAETAVVAVGKQEQQAK